MGLLFPEDRSYREDRRMTGFNRYKQLLSRHGWEWLRLNLITLLGALPLTLGICFSIASSSILVLIPASTLGGMVFGPFLSGLYDNILRRFRDDAMPWTQNYAKSWRQNLTCSLMPGAVLGLMVGLYSFMAMLFWWSAVPVDGGTVALYLMSMVLALSLVSLYWPQLVLFRQSAPIRLRNCLIFALQHPMPVLKAAAALLLYGAVLVLFAPWTLLTLPITGIWHPVFLSMHLLYDRLNEAFGIEVQIAQEAQRL